MRHHVTRGPGLAPIRPEYLAATLSELAAEDALFSADTGTACIWAARYLQLGPEPWLFGSFSWASKANASPNAFGAQMASPGRQTISSSRKRGCCPYRTDLANPDFSRVAEAVGATGIRIEDPAQVRDGLAAALANENGPTVVDVVIDKHALSLPAHVTAETIKGFTPSLARQMLGGRAGDVIPEITHNVGLI